MINTPPNPYGLHKEAPKPTLADQLTTFLGQHRAKVLQVAFGGVLLLIAGIVQASIAGHVHHTNSDLSELAQKVMTKGIILALVGAVIAATFGFAWAKTKRPPLEEEQHLLELRKVTSQTESRLAKGLVMAMIFTVIGLTMATVGSQLHDAPAMGVGITFTVIAGLGGCASGYKLYKLQKQRGEEG